MLSGLNHLIYKHHLMSLFYVHYAKGVGIAGRRRYIKLRHLHFLKLPTLDHPVLEVQRPVVLESRVASAFLQAIVGCTIFFTMPDTMPGQLSLDLSLDIHHTFSLWRYKIDFCVQRLQNCLSSGILRDEHGRYQTFPELVGHVWHVQRNLSSLPFKSDRYYREPYIIR